MGEWQSVKLSEICNIRYGKDHKKLNDGNIPVYGSGGLMRYVDRAIHNSKSVLIPRKGTLGNLFFVNPPFWTVDTLFWTDINTDVVYPEFLYYQLKTLNLETYNVGTAVPSLTTVVLNDILLVLPDLDEQKIIANYLVMLDNKIELNNKINNNLEQQADALFDDFFLHRDVLPVGWKQGSLLDIADYLNGLAMQKFRPAEGEDGIPVLKIKELRQGMCDLSSELCTPNIKSEYIVSDGDVIFSWSGSLLVDFWCGGICGLNQHLFKVTSSKYDKWFYYAWTKHHLAKFIALASAMATTMGHIKRSELANSDVLIPSNSDYEYIGSVLQPIHDLIIANRIENVRLSNLRDELLPQLMSGELDVSEVEL